MATYHNPPEDTRQEKAICPLSKSGMKDSPTLYTDLPLSEIVLGIKLMKKVEYT